MNTRRTRVWRGLVAASVATFAAAFSHGIADGAAPSPFALAVAGVLSVFVCVLLAGRRLSLGRLSASVVLSQLAYHVLFALVPPATGTVTGAGHHGGVLTVHVDAVSTAAHAHGGDAPMWVGHVMAALVTIAALRRGEQAFWALFVPLRLAVLALFGRLLSIPPRHPAARPRPDRRDVPAVAAIVLSAVRRRGPPLVA